MPFGLVNGPAVFTIIVNDLREKWMRLFGSNDSRTNCRLIIDDCFIWSDSVDAMFALLRCIFQVARSRNLSFKLKKFKFFPSTVTFVGVDVSVTGNAPADDKKALLANWRSIDTCRYMAAFIGFVQFYSRWISYLEIRIAPLRSIMLGIRWDYHFLPNDWTDSVIAALADVKRAILDGPILARVDPNKRIYLKTDFSLVGLGAVACQPDAMRNQLRPCSVKMLVGLVSLIERFALLYGFDPFPLCLEPREDMSSIIIPRTVKLLVPLGLFKIISIIVMDDPSL